MYELNLTHQFIGTLIMLILGNNNIKQGIIDFVYYTIDKIKNCDYISAIIILNIVGFYIIMYKIKIEINIKYSLN